MEKAKYFFKRFVVNVKSFSVIITISNEDDSFENIEDENDINNILSDYIKPSITYSDGRKFDNIIFIGEDIMRNDNSDLIERLMKIFIDRGFYLGRYFNNEPNFWLYTYSSIEAILNNEFGYDSAYLAGLFDVIICGQDIADYRLLKYPDKPYIYSLDQKAIDMAEYISIINHTHEMPKEFPLVKFD